MRKNNVIRLSGRDTIIDPLTELLRTGAEQLIYQAVEASIILYYNPGIVNNLTALSHRLLKHKVEENKVYSNTWLDSLRGI